MSTSIQLSIVGMTCGHCKSAVEKAIRNVEGIETVEVDLEAGKALAVGEADIQAVIRSVEEEGYDVTMYSITP